MNMFSLIGVVVISFPLIIGTAILIATWRAWWFYPAWAWFIVPLGAPQITFWHFTALLVLVSVLTNHDDHKKDDRQTEWSKVLAYVVMPIFVWCTLWWMHR
jgi:hypothetical protein